MKTFLSILVLLTITFSTDTLALDPLDFILISDTAELVKTEGIDAIFESKLHELDQKEVVVRGFLFQTSTGKWILSEKPNVKSCCAGSPTKAIQQIFLDGSYNKSDINKAVTLQGKFIIDIQKNQLGSPLQYYRMSPAKKISNSHRRSPFAIISITTLAVLAAATFIRNKRRKNSNP
ncbi:MAG: hypothetical protein ACI9S8_002096 [Chlamydiales bacterium]|jgi:hypothetical protein